MRNIIAGGVKFDDVAVAPAARARLKIASSRITSARIPRMKRFVRREDEALL
jgi:hypothetical protein